MGQNWKDFLESVFKKSADVGTIIFDVLNLLVILVLIILTDLAKAWFLKHVGMGSEITQGTLLRSRFFSPSVRSSRL